MKKSYNQMRQENFARVFRNNFKKNDIINFKEIRTLLPDANHISRNGLFAIFQTGCDLKLFKRIENDGHFPRYITL